MNRHHDPAEIMRWLRSRPSASELQARFPDEWAQVERELIHAMTSRDPLELHALLHPLPPAGGARTPAGARQQARQAVRQKIAALAIRHYSLLSAAHRAGGATRFNWFNGLLAQWLLFRRALERKPVSLPLFRLLWPLVWQRHLLMPLVERKGIYCFYSREFIEQVAGLVAGRPCLEIAAGDGTFSRFLQDKGVDVKATDDHSWHDRIDFPASVEKLGAAAALKKYAPQVVLCSWPPAGNAFEREVFTTRSVELYIVICSAYRFASGNWSVYETQGTFDFERRPDLARLLLPPELQCEVLVFQRKQTLEKTC
jgi:hypothetical protein